MSPESRPDVTLRDVMRACFHPFFSDMRDPECVVMSLMFVLCLLTLPFLAVLGIYQYRNSHPSPPSHKCPACVAAHSGHHK